MTGANDRALSLKTLELIIHSDTALCNLNLQMYWRVNHDVIERMLHG